MIEIWREFIRYKITNQLLADQVRTTIKKGWISDVEIYKIHQQIFGQTNQLTPNTVTETQNKGKPETPYQTQYNNDRYTTNTPRQTLIQEVKINVDIIERIMSNKETTFSSLRNQDWKKVKSETEKVNDL